MLQKNHTNVYNLVFNSLIHRVYGVPLYNIIYTYLMKTSHISISIKIVISIYMCICTYLYAEKTTAYTERLNPNAKNFALSQKKKRLKRVAL